MINTLKVEKINLFEDEKAIRDICYHLACQSDKDIGKTYEWMASLWESHFGKKEYLTLLVRDQKYEPLAVLPFYEDVVRIKGLRFKMIKPLSTLYSTNGGLIILRDEYDVITCVLEYLDRHRDWDIIEICVERKSKVDLALKEHFRILHRRFHMRWTAYESSPCLLMEENIEKYLASKSGNFRSNLKRKEKKLKGAGDLRLHICTAPEDVNRTLKELFEIEKKSWKVNDGTAITSKQVRINLYTLLAARTAAAGWLRIYVLKLDNKPIAFDYGLLFENKYSMLKTSYDEDFKHLSPGIILRWYVIKDLFNIGCKEHDFLWGTEHYKLQWSNYAREHDICYIYKRKLNSTVLFYIQNALDYLRK